jgi:hypothetical protein
MRAAKDAARKYITIEKMKNESSSAPGSAGR